VTQTEEFDLKTLKSVWVSCPYPVVSLGLEKMLGAKTRVYSGQEPLANGDPSSIIICPDEEDVASEVDRLRPLALGAPILVLSLRLDPQFARTALLAGAHGFIHLAMRPAQIVRALSAASKGETVVPKDLLGAFLEEMVSREDPIVLTPRQQEFLELVATSSVSSWDEIVVPRELLEAFLEEAAMT
jgi:DNA-binding NarL/FixJ family response regulator